MRFLFFFLLLQQLSCLTFGQKLEKETVEKLFTSSTKERLGITFPIFRVYEYADHNGKHFFVMTENPYQESAKDPLNDVIKGFCISEKGEKMEVLWSLRDFKEAANNKHDDETSIWFWSKYCQFTDIDKDGLVEPIIVYGTAASNGMNDGRIKILIYYKGQKVGIRHQNGISDGDRYTKVDKTFYTLPVSIQQQAQTIMTKIMDNGHGIFPYGWQEAMKNKKEFFDEN